MVIEVLQWGRRFLTAETAINCIVNAKQCQLQWGRRFLTAETRFAVAAGPLTPSASMGPPFFDGGNHFLGDRQSAGCSRFNGAAVF